MENLRRWNVNKLQKYLEERKIDERPQEFNLTSRWNKQRDCDTYDITMKGSSSENHKSENDYNN